MQFFSYRNLVFGYKSVYITFDVQKLTLCPKVYGSLSDSRDILCSYWSVQSVMLKKSLGHA